MRRMFVGAIAADSSAAASCVDAIPYRMRRACGPARPCIPLPPDARMRALLPGVAPTPDR